MCRIQHTESSPPKFVLTRPAFIHNRNYNALPCNYENSLNIKDPSPMLQIKIDGVAESDKYFTPK